MCVVGWVKDLPVLSHKNWKGFFHNFWIGVNEGAVYPIHFFG